MCLLLLDILFLLIAMVEKAGRRNAQRRDKECGDGGKAKNISLQLSRIVTPTRKLWRGATFTRRSKSILLVSLLAALWITMAAPGRVPAAAAASYKDASGDVAVGEVDGVVIELPEDADQETKDLWQQHRELEKKLQQLRGSQT